jgi:hypothetical protein
VPISIEIPFPDHFLQLVISQLFPEVA